MWVFFYYYFGCLVLIIIFPKRRRSPAFRAGGCQNLNWNLWSSHTQYIHIHKSIENRRNYMTKACSSVKKKKKKISTTNWCFEVWLNIIKIKYNWISVTHCCYISALVLACFRLKKGRATFFRHETIVSSFLYLMVLFFKVIFIYT